MVKLMIPRWSYDSEDLLHSVLPDDCLVATWYYIVVALYQRHKKFMEYCIVHPDKFFLSIRMFERILIYASLSTQAHIIAPLFHHFIAAWIDVVKEGTMKKDDEDEGRRKKRG
jgi:hypothetical protein